MSPQNQQVEAFLKFYYGLTLAPQYAVMLKGPWGSGKTWFIKRSLEALKQSGGRALYVSLYGISNTKQIEAEFYRQLHPIWASKGMELTTKVLKGVAKATLKIDLDGDGRDDASISVGIPELGLQEYLRDTQEHVLVFDDVERCSMPIAELLGYINYYVEHSGQKVVLLANEDEILAKEAHHEHLGSAYRRIKEKLVGRTFEIEPDFDDAMDAFVMQIESPASKHTLDKNRNRIGDLYRASTFKNLRHVRQALLDYARLVDALDEPARQSDDLLADLLTTFLIYSFEIRSGSMLPSDILEVKASFQLSLGPRGQDEPEGHYRRLTRKYAGFAPFDTVFPDVLWSAIFATGLLDSSAIEQAVSNSKYFASTRRAEWVLLWHAYELPDEQVESLIESVSSKFYNQEYDELNIVRHVAGMLLEFSRIGLHARPKQDVLEAAMANVDALKKAGKLSTDPAAAADITSRHAWAGLMFMGDQTQEFQTLSEYARARCEEAIKENYPAEASDLLALMTNDLPKFCRSIILSNHEDNHYYSIPIFVHVNFKKFVQTLGALAAGQIRLVSATLRDRYAREQFNRELAEEAVWLNAVAGELQAASRDRRGKMSGHLLGLLGADLRDAAERVRSAANMQTTG